MMFTKIEEEGILDWLLRVLPKISEEFFLLWNKCEVLSDKLSEGLKIMVWFQNLVVDDRVVIDLENAISKDFAIIEECMKVVLDYSKKYV